MSAAQRAIDAALDMIRRLRREAPAVPVGDFSYRLGDDVPRAVPPRSAADEAAGAAPRHPADDLGPEYEIDWGDPDARLRERVQAADQSAADAAAAQAAQARYRSSTMPPPPSMWTPEAGLAAAGAGVGLGAIALDEALTGGGTAELAAEVPPLNVKPDDLVSKPAARSAADAVGETFAGRDKAPPSPGQGSVSADVLRRRARNQRFTELSTLPQFYPDPNSVMTEEEAARAQLAEERAALRQSRSMPPKEIDKDIRDAVGRGSLYPQEARLVENERRLREDYETYGMEWQDVLPPAMRDAAAGRDTVGRFRFVHSPTGLRAIDTSPTPQEQAAEFRKWANEQPGSERQATYDPAGYAEWERKITEMRHRDYLADNAKYGSAEGPGWRDRLTPEQVAAREARRVAGHEDRLARFARKEAMKTDPMFADTRAKQAEQAADLARRQNNRRLLQQNPFLTLGDPGLNEWQQFVLSQNLLRGDQRVTDPNTVKATHNEQALELMKRFTNGQGFQQPMTPDQLRLLGIQVQQKEAELPPAVQAESYREKPGVHPSEEQMVDDYVSQRYSTPGSWLGLGGLSSSFTPDEQAKVVAWLVNEKKYTPEKAKLLVDSIAGKRNTQSWFGN